MPAPSPSGSAQLPEKPYTKAGGVYLEALTSWLQDTRLMSEAVFRLFKDYDREGRIVFSEASWPKPKKTDLPIRPFAIKPIELGQRMHDLLTTLWSTRFVFLETLWEEYLEELVKELRHSDASIFEPFCEREFMADIVRDVLTNRLDNVDDIKDEVAARFATGITRQSWDQQWNQLARLKVGLTKADQDLPWYKCLDEYFEMRNCIIHRQGEVSPLLRQKSSWYPTPLEVDFLYAMARFTPPAEEEVPNVDAGPVLRSFAGWANDPGAPTLLILGLGYERDQAIGAVEYIEPAEVWAFDPSGSDAEYSNAIKVANEQLWSMRPKPPRRIRYDPAQVFQTFGAIEGLLASLVRRSRPVILPFGPKTFSLAALLAARFHPEAAVWRVSAGSTGTPVQRMASGVVVGLRARFTCDGSLLGV